MGRKPKHNLRRLIDRELDLADNQVAARIEDQGEDGEPRVRDTRSTITHHSALNTSRSKSRLRQHKAR